ncbi:CBS domain-containing protein [Nocardioides sp. Arc9.136]|uniref:CBS domain-containing protein n=1 Tax=Nocardioides sp. Arc9.136 TaxID=2996826 RepID=UPI0026671585|nr:CBS domain-containing protein [Nocardioides sp. Arc9.136]WKN47383.1 CBS domain-containing protein [Nocardioides sp. Arc9.136]
MHIGEVLSRKPRSDVVTIRPDAVVGELVALLAEHNVGALVVSVDGTSVDGIVSERDVVRRLHADAAVAEVPVAAIMTPEVTTCSPASALDELMRTMTDRRVRHVPVVEDGRLVGIVSIGDLVKHKIGELQFERDQLDSYVHQT